MPVGENGYQAGNLFQGRGPAKKKGRYARPFHSRNGCPANVQTTPLGPDVRKGSAQEKSPTGISDRAWDAGGAGGNRTRDQWIMSPLL